MFLRFVKDKQKTLYPITNEQIKELDSNRVKLNNKNIPAIAGGFDLIIDEDNLIDYYRSYTVVYDDGNNYIVFTKDKSIYYTYYLYNEDNYIYGQQTTTIPILDAAVLRFSGQGKDAEFPVQEELFDEDGFYLYKVVGGKVVNTTAEEKTSWLEKKTAEELKEAKQKKQLEISNKCQESIVNGVELNGYHYKYDFADQNNISNVTNMALKTGLDVPYHADGEDCRLFTKEEIIELYVAEESNVTHNVTYNNQMKDYIDSLDNIDDVNNVQFGDKLTGKWLETYNAMMTQAQAIIEAFIGGDK